MGFFRCDRLLQRCSLSVIDTFMNAGYEIHDLKNFRSRGKNSARSGVFNAVNIFFRDCDAFHLKQGEDTVQSFLISSDTTVSVYMNIHIWVMLFQRTNLLDHFVDEKYSLLCTPLLGVR